MGSRIYCGEKRTVESSTELSIFRLNGWGLLNGWHNTSLTWTRRNSGKQSSIGIVVDVTGQPYAKVNYAVTDRDGNKTDYDYKIQLISTPCRLGGVRYWFICPLVKNGIPCGRQVAKLYLVGSSKYFGCRHCYNLTYESRNEPHFARPGGIGYSLKADRLIEELYQKVKHRTWRGRPTRKMRRITRLEEKGDIITHYPKWFKLQPER